VRGLWDKFLVYLPALQIKPFFAGMPHGKAFARQWAGSRHGFKEAGFLYGRQ
jgi:hypothetical protein